MKLEQLVIYPGAATTNRFIGMEKHVLPIRTARRYDDFAADLEKVLSVPVRVSDDLDLPAPVEGTLYLCARDVLENALTARPEQALILTAHTVLVDIIRTYALKDADRLGLAAVIETHQYLDWKDGNRQRRPSALCARKDIGQTFGATWPEWQPLQTERYAWISHPAFPELPALLAAYLTAYARFI
ncbi:MAG: hypothetical protein V2B20_09555 [Pseudomonadota bacterium]